MQETKLTPEGRVIARCQKSAGPGPPLCPVITKLTNCVVATGDGVAVNESSTISAGGVGVGDGEGEGVGVGVGVGVGEGALPFEIQLSVMFPNSLFQPSITIRYVCPALTLN